jgi:putative hemolysin
MPEPSQPPLAARLLAHATESYAVRFADAVGDVQAAQALRFAVFNLELGEGLASSTATGLDQDPFDAVCDHLLVEHLATREIVGTYRLQTGLSAAAHLGYYSAQEFDFTVYEPLRPELIELGRACVHRQHRNLTVLGLLWKGIAAYASERQARYLVGCSSITSQDPAAGAAAYAELCRRQHLVAPELQTRPRPAFECPLASIASDAPKIPKLLSAYLGIGAKICGPPALDQEFKTIDFLTILDLQAIPVEVRKRFLL